MRSFKFSEQEVELLIAMYEDELNEVMDYSDRLKETLKKLRNESAASLPGAPVKEGKKRGRKPGSKSKKPATTGKKRGRKPKAAQPEAIEVPQPETSAKPKAVAEKKAPKKKKAKSSKKAGRPVKVKTVSASVITPEPVL